MKKIVLTLLAAASIFLAQAQQMQSSTTLNKFEELGKITDKKELKTKLSALSKSDNEGDLTVAIQYYQANDEVQKAEEIVKSVLKKFPKGNFAFEKRVEEFQKIQTLEEKDVEFQKIKNDFPNQNYFLLGATMASSYASLGNEQKMIEYVNYYADQLSDGRGNKIDKRGVFGSVAGVLANKNPDAAVKYLFDDVEYKKTSLEELSDPAHPRHSFLDRAVSNYYNALSTYLNALSKSSNPEKGYEESKAYYEKVKLDKSLNENILMRIESSYCNALIATNRLKEAFPYMEKTIIRDNVTNSYKEDFKRAYIASHNDEAGFVNYMSQIDEKKMANIKNDIAQKSINMPSHDFELKDVDGNSVKLSDLKGKIVVLDFWATWCGPCKASFPSMQKAVNKYKEDKNVVFLFIHTWEKGIGDPIRSAKKYVVDNNYTFQVLMDLRNPETNISAVAEDYKVKGIPTKIIIDTNGRVRFNTSGFFADEERSVVELSEMIEFARKG